MILWEGTTAQQSTGVILYSPVPIYVLLPCQVIPTLPYGIKEREILQRRSARTMGSWR